VPKQKFDGKGRRLAEVRLSRGLSQIGLARKLGLTEKTIQHYEAGRVDISFRRADQLARELEVSPATLFDEPGTPIPPRSPKARSRQ